MLDYYAYYINSQDHIMGREEIEAEDDRSALNLASGLLSKAAHPQVGIEVWQRDRCIGRLTLRSSDPALLRATEGASDP